MSEHQPITTYNQFRGDVTSCVKCGADWVCRARLAEDEAAHTALTRRVAEESARADKNMATIQEMVRIAAENRLDGYRELGQRAATAESERDAAMAEAGRYREALGKISRCPDCGHAQEAARALAATTPPAASERREAEVRPRDIGVVRDLVRTVHGVSERKWIDSAKHEECWCGGQWDSSFDGHRRECKAVRDALAALDAAEVAE